MAPGVLPNCELSNCAQSECSPLCFSVHLNSCPLTSPLLLWCLTVNSYRISQSDTPAPFDHPLLCVFVVTPGGGLWWLIPRARPTSGWKTWRRPIACISLNWVMLTLYALWRIAFSLARQVSISVSLVWCLCCCCLVCLCVWACLTHTVAVPVTACWGLSLPQWLITAVQRLLISFVLCSGMGEFI